MSRRSSPRPSYDRPTAIRHQDATLHLWGDDEAGYVQDRIYVSSDRVHQLEFSLPPGGHFQHSDDNRTIFAADEYFHVLEGTLVLANPETGEVQRVREGEGAFFRRDTWHHGFNHGTTKLRVLELFAPPPSQGTSSVYAKTKEDLAELMYRDDSALTRWPMQQEQVREGWRFKTVRDEDTLWRLENPDGGYLVGIRVSTEHLTVGQGSVLPGRTGPVERHDGDECLYVLDGCLNVLLPDAASGQSWFELGPGDGCYLPRATTHQYRNVSAQQANFLFAVAPSYLPVPPDETPEE